MKMIYIPPLQMLSSTGDSHRQLMLPHMTWNEDYGRYFGKAKPGNKYTILDNGAAESVKVSFDKLASTANAYDVDELVLPDALGDRVHTNRLAVDFLVGFGSKINIRTQLGYVLHGYDVRDTIEAYEELKLNRALFNRLGVLYLPRMLVTDREPLARLDVARYILKDERLPKAIHFLGAAPHFLREVKHVAAAADLRIRSMDTSAPFVYAIRGRSVEEQVHIKRDIETYFGTPMTNDQKCLAWQNMATMDGWVSAKARTS